MTDALDVGVGLKSTVGCYFMIITRVLQAVPIQLPDNPDKLVTYDPFSPSESVETLLISIHLQ
jgi:hypothetical protein